jgi:hypothetical protein
MNPLSASWPLESQSNGGVDSRTSDASRDHASTTQITPPETKGSLQNLLKAEHLANAWVPEEYRTALERIYDRVKIFAEPQKDQQQTTANAIRTLQEAEQQLASNVELNTQRTSQRAFSYAAVAGKGGCSRCCNCCSYFDKAASCPAQKRDYSHKGQGAHQQERSYESRVHRTVA